MIYLFLHPKFSNPINIWWIHRKIVNKYMDTWKNSFKIYYRKWNCKKNSLRAGSSMVSHKKKRWNKVGFFMFVCLCTQYYKFLRFDASMLVTREYLLARLVGFKNRCIHFTLRGFVLNAFEYYSLYHLYSLEVTLAWSNV